MDCRSRIYLTFFLIMCFYLNCWAFRN